MKRFPFLIAGVLLVITSCQKDEISESTTSALTASEIEDLDFLIQEEKLARDVYIYSFEKYGQNVFNNISNSEQSHMDQVAGLLLQYNLPNPIIGLANGEFENVELQQLYYDLTAMVDGSYIDALTVGATIEDLDINDIDELIDHTNKVDLLSVYANLTCGSRNHLRSYYDKLQSNGADYTPQYISQAVFEGIVTTEKESCSN